MQFSDELDFTHRDRKDVYEYIERCGNVEYERVYEALNMQPTAFGHHVAILKRDGIIEQQGDRLRMSFDCEVDEEFSDNSVEYVIRQAREEDRPELLSSMRETIGDRYIVAETVADIVDHENVLLRHNDLESRVFFVATVGEDVVGWVHLTSPEMEKLSHTAELTVGVHDEYQGHGIGSQLLEKGLDWAAENGYEKVYNSVPSTNENAIEFLAAHGWETEAVREDQYKIEGKYIDEVMMATWPRE